MERALREFREYLIQNNKSESTITAYLSHIKRILENEIKIRDKSDFINRIGYIHYKVQETNNYGVLSKKTRSNYCSALNSFFDFAFQDYEQSLITITEYGDLDESKYDNLVLNLASENHLGEAKIVVKRVKKGSIIWTIAILLKGIKDGIQVGKLIYRIITDAKLGDLNLEKIGDYSLEAAKISIDLLSAFVKVPDIQSIVMDSIEITMNVIDIIKQAADKER